MNRTSCLLLAVLLHMAVLCWLNPQSDLLPTKAEKKYLEVALVAEVPKSPEPGPIKSGPDSGPDETPKAAAAAAPLVVDSPPPAPIAPPPEPDPAPPPPTAAPAPITVKETPFTQPPRLSAPIAAATVVSAPSTAPGNAAGAPVSGNGHGNAAQWSRGSGGNGHFFRAFCVPRGINWADANQFAKTHGGSLASIISAEENNFAFNLVDDQKYWLQNGNSNNLGPWLGGFRTPNSPLPSVGWKWTHNNEPFTYTNWSPNQPDNSGGQEDHLEFYSHNSAARTPAWNDLNPARPLHGFVVEYDTEEAYLASHPEIDPFAPLPMKPAPFVRH